VLAGCRERGLLLLNCGSYDNVVRFIPPLVANEQQVRQAARIFEETLESLS
jgi:4-aminobutyrate aminotransferase